jgi:hypothetical protein
VGIRRWIVMSETIRFRFPEVAVREEVEGDVALAVFASECVFGRPRVRIEAGYDVDATGRICVVRVGGDAGEATARILAGLAAVRFGEGGFRVERGAKG